MSTKANPTDTDRLMSNDPLMEDFQRGQRSSYIKGIIALIGVAAATIFFAVYFAEVATL